MQITIKQVKSRKELRQFIHLPAAIHKGHKNWVPPVYMDERTYFNPKKNTAFSYSDTILLLAMVDGKPAGRIFGIINNKYNDEKKERNARFCFLETYDNEEIAKTLLAETEAWAKSKGMEQLVGPLGFSDKDPQGLLVEGFDEPMVIATNCNYSYLVKFVENFGFEKKIDLVVYKIEVPDEIPAFYAKIHERAKRNNPGLNMVGLKNKRAIKPYILPVLTLMNETFREIYAFTPLSEKEMKEFASRYLMILDPRFIKIIKNENKEVVAFIKKSRGYVLPFGIFRILHSQKKTDRLSLLLGAIRSDYRNSGMDTMLGVAMLLEAKKAGLKHIDSHLEMESHFKMRSEMEKMGGVVYKRYRIYKKLI